MAVVDIPIEEDMKSSYLDYAMSVITSRALPDVRDGLKPVQRRILFAMHELGNNHSKPYKKSARVVGEVLGKYHPHGDMAIYDALVRMAQDFSLRAPLVDGQGNFGCFTKDTKVRLADGRNLSFGELVEEDAKGKINYTFTVDAEGKIKIAQINKPRLTIRKARIMKVVLDNGEEIRCTPNHRFMLRDGSYREARDLSSGDSLMPLYTSISTGADDPNLAGYATVLQPAQNRWAYAHHLADAWNMENGVCAKSAGRVRHHADFNKLNNNPTNIARMHWKDHWELHYRHASEMHKDPGYREKIALGRKAFWSKAGNKKKAAERMSRANMENWAKPDYRAKMSQQLSEVNKRYIETHPEKRIELSARATRTLKRLWQSADYRRAMHQKIIKGNKNHVSNVTGRLKFLNTCRRILENGEAVSEEAYEKARMEIYPYGAATLWETGLRKYFQNNPDLVLQELNNNHRVLRTELLDESEDVYDLSIGETHNFALAAGVFVHNSIDGDSPAAMRYTEVRMAELAGEMLKDIEKDTVKFSPNFDGTLQEPTVLPSRVPNLLLNGSAGIAVGMATNIPPHNLNEIADAIISIIDGGAEEDVFRMVQGPDFPTGGSIIGKSQIINAYKTGRGIITVRGKATIEKNEITIVEIPYQVNKTALIEQIVAAVKEKRIEGISNVSDRSDRDGMALVIEVKRGEDPEIVLNQLYSFSDMQKSFGIMNLALVGGQPRTLPLIEMLKEFISFRRDMIIARSKFDLTKAQERLHLLEGFLVALANIDSVVSLIRSSKNAEEARGKLAAAYKLSDKQGAAILDMKLQKLTGLERHGIEEEHKEKQVEIRQLQELLGDEKKILNVIKEETLGLRAKYGQPRRTMIEEGEAEVEIESLIPDEQVVITTSRKGYVKRVPLAEYRAQHRGGVGKVGAETVEEDVIEDVFVTTNHKYILFFTDKGKVHWLKAYRIPEAGRYSHGKPIVNLLQAEGEQVTASIAVDEFKDSEFFFMATRLGTVKRVETSSFSNPRKGGIIAITLREGDSLIAVRKTNGSQGLCLGTRKGYGIHFKEEDVRGVGRSAAGVRGIRLRKGDHVVSATVTSKQFLLTITENGYGKKTPVAEYRTQGRGGMGIINMKAGARNGDIVNVRCVDDGEDAIVTTASGMLIRVPVGQISTVGRNTLGVRVIKLREGEKVSSFTAVPSEQEGVATH